MPADKHISHHKLTEKQRLYLKHYGLTMNRKESAIKAGYPERDAEKRASAIMNNPNVQKYLGKITKKHNEQIEKNEGAALHSLISKLDAIAEAGTTYEKLTDLATPSHAIAAMSEKAKLMGYYAPEKSLNINIATDIQEAMRINQGIKEKEKEIDY
jgi:phage terminase small subunit